MICKLILTYYCKWITFQLREFHEIAQAYEFRNPVMFLRYPKTSGKVENVVKVSKSIKKKALLAGTDPNLSLLNHQNTPSHGVEALLLSSSLVRPNFFKATHS